MWSLTLFFQKLLILGMDHCLGTLTKLLKIFVHQKKCIFLKQAEILIL